jgi:hypothetical protein
MQLIAFRMEFGASWGRHDAGFEAKDSKEMPERKYTYVLR